MSEVKRWSVWPDQHDMISAHESPTGEHVLFEDYAALQARVEAAERVIDGVRAHKKYMIDGKHGDIGTEVDHHLYEYLAAYDKLKGAG